MRLMSSTCWEGIFTTTRNVFHTFMFYILKSTYLYRSRIFFLNNYFLCRHFHRSEGPLQKIFFQIKVEDDLKFLVAQITFKYSKKRREKAAAPWVSAR